MYLPTDNWIIQLEFKRVLIKVTFNKEKKYIDEF